MVMATTTRVPLPLFHSLSKRMSSNMVGLGSGHIRTGLGAVHRVNIDTPPFLDEPRTCAVIGAPLTYGQPFDGVQQGPSALREAGIIDAIKKLGWRLKEHGDVNFSDIRVEEEELSPNLHCNLPALVGACNERIFKVVKKNAEANRFVLTLGGDHSIATGTLGGILSARPNVGVVWVDAHADINTPETSESGNMHGMPLSLLSRLFPDPHLLPGHKWMKNVPKLDLQKLVFVGLRDLDRMERHFITENNIKAFTMYHVDKYGIGKVVEMALDHLGNCPLHLSYDIDACDPVIAPSTGTAVRGGLSYREAHFVAEACAETRMLGSMDLVEVNPSLQGEEAFGISLGEETVELGMAIAASALGNRIL
eukprot:m.170163 g.170163  ORF g.170163 m.170163 type:complete len:365 (-) comp13487_c0_seq13:2340-3434(-)